MMSNIPIRDITATGTPAGSSQIAFDDGQMKRGTVASMADAIRPVASQSEAQVGANNTKTMTPLRVKDSIGAEVGVTIASKAQGDLANTALQPANIGSTVQGYDADLAAIAGLSPTDNDILQRKSGAWTSRTIAQIKTDLAYGTAANFNVGTAANNVVQLDGTAKLPAVDGSQLTNLPAVGGGLLAANNLSDVADPVDALANLEFQDTAETFTRSVVSVISDFSHSIANYNAPTNGVDNADVEIQKALDNQKAVFFPPGNYRLEAPLVGQAGAIVEGAGYTKVRIQRVGVWNGDTLTVSADAQVRGLLFEQLHPGFTAGVDGSGVAYSTTMADRLTGDQGHVALIDGTGGVVENCWVSFGVYGIKLLSTTRASIRDIQGGGSWDALNGNLCETKAVIWVGSTVARPYNTEPTIERVYIGGGNTATKRTITLGTISFDTNLGAGCRDAVLVEGTEGIHFKNSYVCANQYGLNLSPITMCREVTIDDNFIDAPSDAGIFISKIGGASCCAVNISNNKFNGQTIANRAISVSDVGGVSLFGGVISDNITMNHTLAPLLITGARAVSIHDNIVNNFHCRGGGDADPAFASGLVVGGSSTYVESRDNFFGGAANEWGGINNCKWGEYWGGAGNGRSGGANGIFGLAGGAIVAGITTLY